MNRGKTTDLEQNSAYVYVYEHYSDKHHMVIIELFWKV